MHLDDHDVERHAHQANVIADRLLRMDTSWPV